MIVDITAEIIVFTANYKVRMNRELSIIIHGIA